MLGISTFPNCMITGMDNGINGAKVESVHCETKLLTILYSNGKSNKNDNSFTILTVR